MAVRHCVLQASLVVLLACGGKIADDDGGASSSTASSSARSGGSTVEAGGRTTTQSTPMAGDSGPPDFWCPLSAPSVGGRCYLQPGDTCAYGNADTKGPSCVAFVCSSANAWSPVPCP
jgi:hypothetical protein